MRTFTTICDAGAAEISAYDPQTITLSVINNSTVNKIDEVDFADPSKPSLITSIHLGLHAVLSTACSK